MSEVSEKVDETKSTKLSHEYLQFQERDFENLVDPNSKIALRRGASKSENTSRVSEMIDEYHSHSSRPDSASLSQFARRKRERTPACSPRIGDDENQIRIGFELKCANPVRKPN
jgi:hypothetical protein